LSESKRTYKPFTAESAESAEESWNVPRVPRHLRREARAISDGLIIGSAMGSVSRNSRPGVLRSTDPIRRSRARLRTPATSRRDDIQVYGKAIEETNGHFRGIGDGRPGSRTAIS
jgi:hypothetical protein